MAAHPPSVNRFARPCAAISAAASWGRGSSCPPSGPWASASPPPASPSRRRSPASRRMASSTGPSGAAGSWHPPGSPTTPPSTPTFTSGSASSSAPPRPGCWPTAASWPAASSAAGWGWSLSPRSMKSAACALSMAAPCCTSATICWQAALPISPVRRWPAPSPSSIGSAMA